MKHKTKLQLLLLLGQDLKDRNSSTYFVFCYLLLLYVVEIKETVIMFCMQNLSNFSISSIVSSSCSVSILGTLLESNAVVACNEVGRQAGRQLAYGVAGGCGGISFLYTSNLLHPDGQIRLCTRYYYILRRILSQKGRFDL